MKQIVQNIVKYETGLDLENPIPRTVNIEVTNICDLRCIMCKRVERPKGYIRLDLLKDFLPEAKQMGVQQAGLFTVGESILHPKIQDIIQLCKTQGFYTYLDVNGNSLTQEKARKLVESGLDSIKFSIAAVDETTYTQVHGGGSFSNVYNNIKILRKIRDESNNRMRIAASFIIIRKNQKQVTEFQKKMDGVVDEIHYDVVNNVAHRIDEDTFKQLCINGFDIPNKDGVCSNPWTRIILTWDGYVSFCCIDYELDINLGKYQKGNLKTLFSGKTAEALRKTMLDHKYEKLPLICQGCERLKYDMAERAKKINEQFR